MFPQPFVIGGNRLHSDLWAITSGPWYPGYKTLALWNLACVLPLMELKGRHALWGHVSLLLPHTKKIINRIFSSGSSIRSQSRARGHTYMNVYQRTCAANERRTGWRSKLLEIFKHVVCHHPDLVGSPLLNLGSRSFPYSATAARLWPSMPLLACPMPTLVLDAVGQGTDASPPSAPTPTLDLLLRLIVA
jgi:hypothetical protein